MSGLTLDKLVQSDVAARQLVFAGLSTGEAKAKGILFARAAAALIAAGRTRESKAVAIYAPGRIEVFGKHTDYCGGRSLLCAVERGMCFVAVRREGESTTFLALDAADRAVLFPDAAPSAGPGHWSNYPASVVRRIARNFPGHSVGSDIAMASDLPRASGLSSSSAMIVGTFMALSCLNHLTSSRLFQKNLPDRAALAGYLGTVENGQSFNELAGDSGVGTFGGSQDHTAILCCKPGALGLFSFCPVRHHQDIPWPDGVRLIVADSGVVAEKTGNALVDYNSVSATASELISLWCESGGRGACLNDLIGGGAAALEQLDRLIRTKGRDRAAILKARLDQFVAESDHFIPAAAKAFATKDWPALRRLADQSHRNADLWLRNQRTETNSLQRNLIDHGALAASAFGAGFGGSVWGVFDEQGLARWATSDSGASTKWFATRPGCPATEIRIASDD